MNLLAEQQKLKKLVWIAFGAGVIWFTMMVISWIFSSWTDIISDISKGTFHANLVMFITYIWYLKSPHSTIFKTNTPFIMVGSLLMTAAIGFWIIIIPVYSIDLSEYLYNSAFTKHSTFNLFQFLWSHSISQILYMVVIKQVFKCHQKWHLCHTKTKTCLKYWFAYCIFLFTLHAIYSWWDHIAPAYGVFSNWNWNTKFQTKNVGGVVMFNFKTLWFVNLFVIGCGATITYFLCRLSSKNQFSNNH